MNRKIPAYLSMSIRGKKVDDATRDEVRSNVSKAINIGTNIRTTFFCLELFIPHEWEYLTQACLDSKVCTVHTILEYDAAVISLCKVLLVGTSPKDSKGVTYEVNHALDKGIKVIGFDPGSGYYLREINDKLVKYDIIDENMSLFPFKKGS